MTKAKLLEILEKYDIDEYHWKLEIADDILALQPTDEEIETGIKEYYNSGFLRLSETVIRDKVSGAKWCRDFERKK
jgi:hypothetical protein